MQPTIGTPGTTGKRKRKDELPQVATSSPSQGNAAGLGFPANVDANLWLELARLSSTPAISQVNFGLDPVNQYLQQQLLQQQQLVAAHQTAVILNSISPASYPSLFQSSQNTFVPPVDYKILYEHLQSVVSEKEKEISTLKSSTARLTDEKQKWATEKDQLEAARNFYFGETRRLEVIIQEKDAKIIQLEQDTKDNNAKQPVAKAAASKQKPKPKPKPKQPKQARQPNKKTVKETNQYINDIEKINRDQRGEIDELKKQVAELKQNPQPSSESGDSADDSTPVTSPASNSSGIYPHPFLSSEELTLAISGFSTDDEYDTDHSLFSSPALVSTNIPPDVLRSTDDLLVAAPDPASDPVSPIPNAIQDTALGSRVPSDLFSFFADLQSPSVDSLFSPSPPATIEHGVPRQAPQ